jgi:hypothetical protein
LTERTQIKATSAPVQSILKQTEYLKSA